MPCIHVFIHLSWARLWGWDWMLFKVSARWTFNQWLHWDHLSCIVRGYALCVTMYCAYIPLYCAWLCKMLGSYITLRLSRYPVENTTINEFVWLDFMNSLSTNSIRYYQTAVAKPLPLHFNHTFRCYIFVRMVFYPLSCRSITSLYIFNRKFLLQATIEAGAKQLTS